MIAVVATGFTDGFADVQQQWSVLEREQVVLAHDCLIRGLKVYRCIDGKNNLFSEAKLDNCKWSKKMSNWALELQGFDIIRIWIRGEANILSDAPS